MSGEIGNWSYGPPLRDKAFMRRGSHHIDGLAIDVTADRSGDGPAERARWITYAVLINHATGGSPPMRRAAEAELERRWADYTPRTPTTNSSYLLYLWKLTRRRR